MAHPPLGSHFALRVVLSGGLNSTDCIAFVSQGTCCLFLPLALIPFQGEGITRGVCVAAFKGQDDALSCVRALVNSGVWGVLLFVITWVSFLVLFQWVVLRLFCGRLRAIERREGLNRLLTHMWNSLVFTIIVLAPKVSPQDKNGVLQVSLMRVLCGCVGFRGERFTGGVLK